MIIYHKQDFGHARLLVNLNKKLKKHDHLS